MLRLLAALTTTTAPGSGSPCPFRLTGWRRADGSTIAPRLPAPPQLVIEPEPDPFEAIEAAFKVGDTVRLISLPTFAVYATVEPGAIGVVTLVQPNGHPHVKFNDKSHCFPPEHFEAWAEPEKPNPNQHLIAYLKAGLRIYQEAQIKIFDNAHEATLSGNANPGIQAMRRHEISRLQVLCDQIKERLETL